MLSKSEVAQCSDGVEQPRRAFPWRTPPMIHGKEFILVLLVKGHVHRRFASSSKDY